jgi:hypothetical protein
MRRLLALPLLLCGCGDFGILRVVLYTQEDANPINEDSQYETMVREAVGFLGYNVQFTDRKRGAVVLELLDIDATQLAFTGRRLLDSRCYRVAWAVPSAPNIAHEIGHTLGLEHVSTPGNVMLPKVEWQNVHITAEQIDTLDFNVHTLGKC